MVARGEQDRIERFAYKWTRYTSVIANVLCVPFILCASEMLSAYVGEENAHLGIWMILWCITVLVQIHTTPGNSLVIAYGKTRALVITTAAACLLSIVLNVLLCRHFGVGSAVIAYFIYVLIVIGSYYLVYYRKLMGLSRSRMAFSFLAPTLTAFAVMAICMLVVKISPESFGGMNRRLAFILICLVKTACWIIPYGLILLATRQVRLSEFKELKPVKQQ
jgi:O-antigen/teichoic acid export membrane protein